MDDMIFILNIAIKHITDIIRHQPAGKPSLFRLQIDAQSQTQIPLNLSQRLNWIWYSANAFSMQRNVHVRGWHVRPNLLIFPMKSSSDQQLKS